MYQSSVRTVSAGMVAHGHRHGPKLGAVEVALHNDTFPLLLRNASGGPRASSSKGESLMEGEVLVLDRFLMRRHAAGDYRRTGVRLWCGGLVPREATTRASFPESPPRNLVYYFYIQPKSEQ